MAANKDNFALVEESWATAAGLGVETVGVLLFKNVFEIAPGAVALFSSFKNEPNMYESPALIKHASGVVSTVGTAVSMLRKLDELAPVLKDLGTRHVKYGVLEAHYDVVGQALLKTLEMGLGDAFTAEVRQAWTEVYGVVSSTMIGDNYKAEELQPGQLPKAHVAENVDARDMKTPDNWVKRVSPVQRRRHTALDHHLTPALAPQPWQQCTVQIDFLCVCTHLLPYLQHPDLIRLTGKHPFNCEPPLDTLYNQGFITPTSLHYVRNHGERPCQFGRTQ
eukprot:SAG22_NODE_147_length_17533_cov_46.384536_12_plen_278_part_00